MKICPNCGTKNADTAKNCNFCECVLGDVEKAHSIEPEYHHNETEEKKKIKKGKFLVFIVSLVAVLALCFVATMMFYGDKKTKNDELMEILTSSVKEGSKLSGTLIGEDLDITFEISFGKDNASIITSDGKQLSVSKDGMTINGNQKVNKGDEEYPLCVALQAMLAVADKNPLRFGTEEIRNYLLPIIKDNLNEDYDEVFIDENFVGAIASFLMIFDNDPDLEKYMGIVLPADVGNTEVNFNVDSYALQNQTLSRFKKAFKSANDYDVINGILKEVKSQVKNNYKAKGTITTENGALKSVCAKITYEGEAYNLTVNAE